MSIFYKPWPGGVTAVLVFILIFVSGCTPEKTTKEEIRVPVTDYTFDTAGNMFAYTEFELSGEPLVEGLGLDLDLLAPEELDQPSAFDYTAGIESYEYSEEAMYEVVEKSGLGLHLANGPAIMAKGEESRQSGQEVLAQRFLHLAEVVGQPGDQIQRGMFPTFIEYSQGDPHYVQEVNTTPYADGDDGQYIPTYQVDFSSLRWEREKMEQMLIPAAYGGTFLKQALWASDFLGGMHEVLTDEEMEANSSDDDQGEEIALGVSSVDGFQGMILTEQIWNKLLYIRDQLFYQSVTHNLGQGAGSLYRLEDGLVYLPHAIGVNEGGEGEFVKAASLSVEDSRSLLQDQWLMLWPAAEFFGMVDQRKENQNLNPAFLAVFDGDPFPEAAQENLDAERDNDVRADDPYSVARDVMLQVFVNLQAMHWNEKTGVFVTEHDGSVQGNEMDMFQAGYTMEALRIFQRAMDGLPVGYASGEAAKGLGTEQGKEALEMIRRQADFIIEHMMEESGLVANAWEIGEGKDGAAPTLKAQLGAIRGLTAAFLATGEEKYREAARAVYTNMDEQMWNPVYRAYRTQGDEYQYDPWIAGAVSAVLRNAITSLRNEASDQEKPEVLERETIISRYVDFYDQVVDGPVLEEGMQASEFWDTGDLYLREDNSGNTDGDHVPQIQAGDGEYGIAPVLLSVEVKE